MGIMDNLFMVLTYVILFIWIMFPPKVQGGDPTCGDTCDPNCDPTCGDKKVVADIRSRLKLIGMEKACLGQSIVNGIWNVKSKEAKTALATMLVELLSSSGEG